MTVMMLSYCLTDCWVDRLVELAPLFLCCDCRRD